MRMMNAFVLLLAARGLASAAVAALPVRPLPLSAPAAVVFGALSDPARAFAMPLPIALPATAAPWTFAAPTALAAAPAAAAPAPVPARPAEAAPSEASSPVEAQAARAAASFDGSSEAPPAVPSAAPAALGDGLRAMRADDEPWLASVVGELMRTRTGRRVLRDIARLETRRGHPVLVEVAHISNNGEFRYDSDILVMDASHRRSDPVLTAPIMAHELQHVLQRALELPTDALELEIESYTVENHVWSELGVQPPAGSFAAQARRRLLKGGDVFVAWLAKQYKNNFALHGRTLEEYAGKVAEQRAATVKRIARAQKDIATAERALATMRAAGLEESAVLAHMRDTLEPALRRLKEATVTLAWCDRDLALLSDDAARARFRAYSRGVIRRARSLAR